MEISLEAVLVVLVGDVDLMLEVVCRECRVEGTEVRIYLGSNLSRPR